MDDLHLERLALIAIIIGLLVLLLLMPTYEFVDAHYLFEDDNRAFLEGKINKVSFSEDSGWSFVEIDSHRIMNSFYKGKVEKGVGDIIYVRGSFFNDAFSIDEYK